MPLSAARLRLSPRFSCPLLRHDRLYAPYLNSTILKHPHKDFLQFAVFVSCTHPGIRTTPPLRSPLQWSHIVHHVRKPTSLGATTKMAKDSSISLVQARPHTGHSHSHGHHHHHDNTYLTSTNKSDPGVRITRIGLYVNLGMAIAKGMGGYVFNSQA